MLNLCREVWVQDANRQQDPVGIWTVVDDLMVSPASRHHRQRKETKRTHAKCSRGSTADGERFSVCSVHNNVVLRTGCICEYAPVLECEEGAVGVVAYAPRHGDL